MEFGDASGTALMDVETRQWSTKVVDFIADDLPDKLPPCSRHVRSHGNSKNGAASMGPEPSADGKRRRGWG